MIKEFPVKIITRRSRVANQIFVSALIIACVGLFVFYVAMLPSDHSSTELKTLWFIKGVPSWIKDLTLYSIYALILALIVDFLNKRAKKALLIVSDTGITINTKKQSIDFTYEMLKEVAFVGKTVLYNEESESGKIRILFRLKTDEVYRLKLVHYEMIIDLMDSLQTICSKDIKLFSSKFDPYWPEF